LILSAAQIFPLAWKTQFATVQFTSTVGIVILLLLDMIVGKKTTGIFSPIHSLHTVSCPFGGVFIV